jgi:phage terminase large subunit-like protein
MKGPELRARLLAAKPAVRHRLMEALSNDDSAFTDDDFATFCHEGQRPPQTNWRTWLLMAGRGYGKTRAGAEWVLSLVRGNARTYPFVSSGDETPIRCTRSHGISSSLDANGNNEYSPIRIALVAATIDEARDVMVEGPSGLLSLADPREIAEWSRSRHSLRFTNGAEVILYSGANGESLRGPEHHFAWCDELAKWAQAESAWNNLQLGLRMGEFPRALVTTTPRVSALLNRIKDAPDTALTGGPTQANPHLPTAFVSAMERQYAGTRLGVQELEGRLLADVAGSLWPQDLIEQCRVDAFQIPFVSSADETPIGGARPNGVAPWPLAQFTLSGCKPAEGLDPNGTYNFTRIVVGVDPPASANGTCGIIVCALDEGGHGHVLADCSVSGASPDRWAAAVVRAADMWAADRVVAEKNQGGDMVGAVLRAASANLPIRLVHAAKGKSARAEPVAALFEQGKVWLHGRFDDLEAQLSGLIAGGGYGGPGISPDRADACVWALWALMIEPPAAPPRISVL